ncbi:Conserved_hypothetical protein [Hexamita inflata]|uniref:BCNT-C domain-containing protein n=1 Tax=Hexamita inflata TaxID=28002 RepID=A0AA86QV10_9EUKA|nr:Conserved hypothetical protein [Hexamita inflata]
MSEEELSDSTYVAEESVESEISVQEQQYRTEKKLTTEQLDDLWQELRKIDDQKKQKDEYFQKKNDEEQELIDYSTLITLPDNVFADYALDKNNPNSDKEYLEKLKKYAPKIVTIQETRKFWQMYKSSLSQDQVQILQSYVQSQQSYIERQKFLKKAKE